jgi:hypothetical protein
MFSVICIFITLSVYSILITWSFGSGQSSQALPKELLQEIEVN